MILALLAAACNGPNRDDTGSPELLVDGALELPDVEIGSDGPSVATLWVENIGFGLLTVDVPYFAEDDAFSVASESVTLRRMEAYGYGITFDPQTPFLHKGSLVLKSDDPNGSSRSVAVRGEAFAPVLEVVSSPIEFGTTEVNCFAQQEIDVRNGGNEPLVVTPSLEGSSEFVLGSEEPFTIEPSMSAPILVAHRPADVGTNSATLTVESNDPIHPTVTVELTGTGLAPLTRTDVYEMGPRKTDAVLVVDDSSSMDTEQSALADHIDAFISALEAGGVDYQIGVISTDDPSFYGPVVTDATADPAHTLADQIASIGTGGSVTPRALQMLYDCVQPGGDCAELSGFLRGDALFAGIIVSDEPDQSAMTPEAYVDYFWSLKDAPDRVRMHAFAGHIPTLTCATCASPGFGYDEAVDLTEGVFLDICTDDWDSALTTLAEQSLAVFPPVIILGAEPVVESIVVEVDGVAVKSGWVYTGHISDGGTNEIQFDLESLPPPGSTIDVSYTIASVCD